MSQQFESVQFAKNIKKTAEGEECTLVTEVSSLPGWIAEDSMSVIGKNGVIVTFLYDKMIVEMEEVAGWHYIATDYKNVDLIIFND